MTSHGAAGVAHPGSAASLGTNPAAAPAATYHSVKGRRGGSEEQSRRSMIAAASDTSCPPALLCTTRPTGRGR